MIWAFYAVAAVGVAAGFVVYAYATGKRHGKRERSSADFNDGYKLGRQNGEQEGYNTAAEEFGTHYERGVLYGQHHPKRDHGRFVSPDVPTSH